MPGALDALRLLTGLGFLVYASWSDLRTRRVPNATWLGMSSVALLILAVDVGLGTIAWTYVALAAGVIGLAYGLWYVHLLAGGADAKALMALAVLAPAPVAWHAWGTDMPLYTSPLPTSLVTLSNAVLVFALAPFALAAVNAMRRDVSFPAMLLGYTMSLPEARQRFVWIMDRIDEQGRHRKQLMPSRLSPQQQEGNAVRLEAAGVHRVWVTPKIPFMVPLAAGYLAAFTVGDILFRLVGLAVGR